MILARSMNGDQKLAIIAKLDKVRDGILCGEISPESSGLSECLDRVLRKSGSFQSIDPHITPLKESVDKVIRERIIATLPITSGHRADAAKLLKICTRTIYNEMSRLGIRFPRFRSKRSLRQ
jgi:DNA-binding NtrC family response regulator